MNKVSESQTELSLTVIELIKLAYRDSNWRYSSIGNWLKYQSYKSNDEIKFLKKIKSFSKIQNIRELIIQYIGLNDQLVSNSFILNSKKFEFIIEREGSYFIDHISLEHADKYCLLNQSLNLKYQVWHAIVNTQFKQMKNINDIYKTLPYCKSIYFFDL